MALSCVLLSGVAGAQTVAELADGSRLVVRATVDDVRVVADAAVASPYTHVSVTVLEWLKGGTGESTLTLKQLGGALAGVGLYIEGQAHFAEGDHVLLFLAVRPRDATLYTVGLGAGRWTVRDDATAPGSAVVVSPARTADVVSLDAVRAVVRQSAPNSTPYVAVLRGQILASPSYTLLPTGGPPARWHQADDNAPVEVVSQSNPGGLPTDPIAALGNATARWNGAGSRLRLSFTGSQPVSPPCNYGYASDGRIRVFFNDPCGELADDGVTFGIGGGFYTTGDQRTVNGTTFQEFVQGLAVLNNAGPHLASAGCYEDAVTHKLGHAIGLGHSSVAGAVMAAQLPGGCASGPSSLGQDDVEGLRAIYPSVASGPNPPQPPSAPTSSIVLNTVRLDWTAASSGGPAQSYLVEAGSAPGLANLTTLLVPGSTPSLTVTAVPPGTYYVRVRARNVVGTSAPSPDTTVVVGPCAAPAAPESFAASTGDTGVLLTWNPPATGGLVQGYRLLVGSSPGLSNLLVQTFGAGTAALATNAAYGNYYVRLAAINACGIGPATPDVLVRVQPCTAPPAAPTGLSFTRTGNEVTLTWSAPATGIPARYLIVVGSAPGAANLLVQPTNGPATSFATTAPRGTYYVRVVSQSACGTSSSSNEVVVAVP